MIRQFSTPRYNSRSYLSFLSEINEIASKSKLETPTETRIRHIKESMITTFKEGVKLSEDGTDLATIALREIDSLEDDRIRELENQEYEICNDMIMATELFMAELKARRAALDKTCGGSILAMDQALIQSIRVKMQKKEKEQIRRVRSAGGT